MDDYYCKRSGQIQVQIPAFGDWDNANQLPITQYFECARQAGLIRYSSSSGESTIPTYVPTPPDLYAVDLNQPSPTLPRKQARGNREKVSNKRVGHGHGGKLDERMMMTKTTTIKKQQQKNIIITATSTGNNINGKVRNVNVKDHQRQLARKGGVNPNNQDEAGIIAPHVPALHVIRPAPPPPRPHPHPIPVDEDLYKIPPELLRNSKRSKSCKVRGLFSRCLVPACNS